MALDAGEVLAVPADRLREAWRCAIRHSGDLILRAYLIRRDPADRAGHGFRIVGSPLLARHPRLREFAARNRLPHRFVDLESDADAESLLRPLGVTPEETTGRAGAATHKVLRNPDATPNWPRLIGLARHPARKTRGCTTSRGRRRSGRPGRRRLRRVRGTAHRRARRRRHRWPGGTSSRIENYLGFPAGISGAELAERAVIQARKFGARITMPARGRARAPIDGLLRSSHSTTDVQLTARTVIIATGARYRQAPRAPARRVRGRRASTTRPRSSRRRMCGDPVAVVGGGNSAGQATVFLAQTTSRVYLVTRDDDLRRHMSQYLIDQVNALPNVEVVCSTEVRELRGDHTISGVVVEQTATGERRELAVGALFVFIGATPCTGWLAGSIALDRNGFVLTGEAAGEARTDLRPMLLESSWPGVFAAGDVRSGSVKRVASAVGEGAMSVHLVESQFWRDT